MQVEQFTGFQPKDVEPIEVVFNGVPCSVPTRHYSLSLNSAAAELSDTAPDGSDIDFALSTESQPTLADVLLAAEFNPAVADLPYDAVYDKGAYQAAYSGFEGTIGGDDGGEGLGAWLDAHDVDHVVVCGLATDYCVRATAADAAKHGYRTEMLLDLSAAVSPDRVPQVVAGLQEAGVVVAG